MIRMDLRKMAIGVLSEVIACMSLLAVLFCISHVM